jgi:hypothetical protein
VVASKVTSGNTGFGSMAEDHTSGKQVVLCPIKCLHQVEINMKCH